MDELFKNPVGLPERFLEIKEVAMAMRELRMISGDKEVWDNFTAQQMEMNRWHASNTTSYKQGKADGIAEGRAKGRAEGMKEDAKNLSHRGVDVNQISQATGLSIDDIKK